MKYLTFFADPLLQTPYSDTNLKTPTLDNALPFKLCLFSLQLNSSATASTILVIEHWQEGFHHQ